MTGPGVEEAAVERTAVAPRRSSSARRVAISRRSRAGSTPPLDAGGNGTGLVVRGGADATFRGLTIRDGYSGSHGGGVRCAASRLALEDVVVVGGVASSGGAGLSADGCELDVAASRFAGNQTGGRGGGMYLDRSTGTVQDSEIAGNHAGDGGGVFQLEGGVELRGNDVHDNQAVDGGGGVWNESDAPVTGNRIADNRAGMRGGGLSLIEHAAVASGNTVSGNRSGDDGAGVFVFLSQATVSDSEIFDNQADADAGGLRVLGSQATITGNRVHDNTAGADGGGMKISHDESVVHDNTFDGNVAGGLGGGVELDDDHSTLARIVITNNRAYGGGGLHCNVVGVAFRVENTLIAHNTATGSGGAVRYDGVYATGTFSFVTMANNSSPDVGGADFADGDARVDDSIIAGNDGTQVRFDGGEVMGWRYTDTAPATVSGMSSPSGAGGNISQAPAFVDASRGDYHLRADSPCRNAGDPAMTDRDGSRADMGAYGGPDPL